MYGCTGYPWRNAGCHLGFRWSNRTAITLDARSPGEFAPVDPPLEL